MFRSGCNCLTIGLAIAAGVLLGCVMPTAFLLFVMCCVTLWICIMMLFFR